MDAPAEIEVSAADEDLDFDLETGSCTTVAAEGEEQKLNLAKNETAAVFKLRLLVFLVLFLASVAVSIIVYLVSASAEKDEYRSQYEGASKKVLESFLDIVDTKLGAVSAMGVAIIAHGVDHLRSWPFVTLSSFQQRASTARKQSGALFVHINPMVHATQKEEWESFVVSEDSYWIGEGLEYQQNIGLLESAQDVMSAHQNSFYTNDSYPIWTRGKDGAAVLDANESHYMPTWQTSPVYYEGTNVNENLLKSSPSSVKAGNASFYDESVVIGEFISSDPGNLHSSNPQTALMALMLSAAHNKNMEYAGDPMSQIFFPIFDSFKEGRKSVAVMGAWIHWMSYFQYILPSNLKGIYIVLHDSCSGAFTYEVNGEDVHVVGKGDLHDARYDGMKESKSFDALQNIGDGTKYGLPLNKDHCMISIDVYPSQVFYDTYNTNTPIIMTISVAMIFIFTACMFVFYDRLVERRQLVVMSKALQTNAVVESLFPANVRDRLMKPGVLTDSSKLRDSTTSQTRRLRGYLSGVQEEETADAPPIADLFPHCTVLFADIAGFTAWSSTRDPEQVFILLQTVYQAFDRIAKRRKVFKVETIGDSYLAVCGLPEPQPNHSLIMARFAWDCMTKMHQVMKELEYSLGPDTGDLSMRFGLHSGPVTAGVLRGDRARFQLFGDTVNTASRMESLGHRGKIQISQTTATLIREAGREHWLTPRKDKIVAKGKGMLQTYFVDPTRKRGSSLDSVETESKLETLMNDSLTEIGRPLKTVNHRLIEWMVDLLMDDIKKIVHVRRQSGIKESATPISYFPPEGSTCMEEVKTVIGMPKFDSKKVSFTTEGDYTKVVISPDVFTGLREYVATISSLYRDNNPFHNFEHACHVTMSVKKLLKRIVTPELSNEDSKKFRKNPNKHLAYRLHDYTLGLTSDPLALLAITFSALIHDVDHRGVSNSQLATEDKELGKKYSNQSVAEQNSVDIAWDVLMQDQFDKLRRCLFTSEAELMRFRQLIVNVVLATDIFDKELNDLRKHRWERAFCMKKAAGTDSTKQHENDNDLRATIVIEHIIQASDVSHTMQHWHVYQKWNKALYREMSRAYREGRMAKDPSEFWYKGEIGFFDNYVIPLAKKLKECGVFGVSSDEYLNYALQNRAEWEERGETIVQALVEESNRSVTENEEDDMDESGRSEKRQYFNDQSCREFSSREFSETADMLEEGDVLV